MSEGFKGSREMLKNNEELKVWEKNHILLPE